MNIYAAPWLYNFAHFLVLTIVKHYGDISVIGDFEGIGFEKRVFVHQVIPARLPSGAINPGVHADVDAVCIVLEELPEKDICALRTTGARA